MPTAKLNGIDIYYEDLGSGPAIVMTHGLGDSAELWKPLAESLARYPQPAMRRDRQAVLEGLTLPIDEGLEREARIHRDTASEPEMADWLRRYAAGDRPPPFRPPE